MFGDIAEKILEELVQEGHLSFSDIVQRLIAQNSTLKTNEVFDIFKRLVESHFLIRLPPVSGSDRGCPTFEQNFNPFALPSPDLATKTAVSKKRPHPSEDENDGQWRINPQQFEIRIREELLLEFLAGIQPGVALDLTQTVIKNTAFSLLRANEARASSSGNETMPIGLYDIIKAAHDNNFSLTHKEIEFSLSVMCEESKYVLRKVGESSGGLYVIDFVRGIEVLAQAHAEAILREKFDAKAVRIFRLLQKAGFLEEEQIEKMVMLNSKENRETLYAMSQEGFVFVQPVGKASDFAPARTFYLYSVDLNRTIRLLTEVVSKFLRNLLIREKHEVVANYTLLDRRDKMNVILKSIDETPDIDEETKQAQKDEVIQVYLTEGDKPILEKYDVAKVRLLASQIEIERVLFIFNAHLSFVESLKPMPKKSLRGRKSAAK